MGIHDNPCITPSGNNPKETDIPTPEPPLMVTVLWFPFWGLFGPEQVMDCWLECAELCVDGRATNSAIEIAPTQWSHQRSDLRDIISPEFTCLDKKAHSDKEGEKEVRWACSGSAIESSLWSLRCHGHQRMDSMALPRFVRTRGLPRTC